MAATSAVVLGRVYLRRRRTRVALGAGGVVVALVVSASRVFLGVHFLTDVVGGLLLGVVLTAGTWGLSQGIAVEDEAVP
jgi:undecaprenyl-diphosphatase